MQGHTKALPHPHRERWQPLRSGLVNLYKYDNEEFHFENGRLLLRGNNGTGKSRVLALQLPFLLDGEINPERLEPDADPSRKMEWNLLMDRYPERTGYTWIEFGRRDKDGTESFQTIGCGLSAMEGYLGVHRWFFITRQRIGQDLELVSDSKQALGADRLRRKMGSAGRVFEIAAEYRRAVNESLFKMDEDRYSSLVNLLIQLRRPQLTRRLEAHKLSKALSEALPPVSSALVTNIATLFRELHADRTQLDAVKIALAGVDEFLAGYRGYAAVAARRFADQVLAVHDEFETSTNEILNAEAECDRLLAELGKLKTALQWLADEEHALEAKIAAFQHSTDGTNAQALERVQRDAVDRRIEAERATANLSEAVRMREGCSAEHVRLKALLEQRQHRLSLAIAAASQAADTAGLSAAHTGCFGENGFPDADNSDWKSAEDGIDIAIHAQIQSAERVSALNHRVASAKSEFHNAAAECDYLSGLLEDGSNRLHAARTEYQTAVTAFLDDTANWTADLAELPLPFDEPFLRSISEWCDRPVGPNPFVAAIRASVDALNVNFAETRAFLKQRERLQTEELQRLENAIEDPGGTEQERLEDIQSAADQMQARLDADLDSMLELDRREAQLRSEVLAVPADEHVRTAYAQLLAVSRHADSLRQRLDEAETYVKRKQEQFQQTRQSRDHAASECGMENRADDPRSLKDAIAQYRFAQSALRMELDALRETRAACAWARLQLEQSAAAEARQKEIADSLERCAVAAQIAFDAAEHAAGNSLEAVSAEIARSRDRLEALRREKEKTNRRYRDTEMAVTRVDERLRGRAAVLSGDSGRRDSAASALRTFAATGLLSLIEPDIDGRAARMWSTARTVEVAYAVAGRLDHVDSGNAAWDVCQKSVPSRFSTLMQTLSAQGFESSAAFHDDVFVATATVAGQPRGMEELRQILFNDVTDRQMLLAARSREILENHIIGEVSTHLRDLLHAAEEQVRQMNAELESHPMSSGMKLRFDWRPAPAGTAGIAEARRRLMELDDNWGPAERRMLGIFLQDQIESVYSSLSGESWEASLAAALDYRKWHSFGVERYQDGVWKHLSERTYGTSSGGEKAVALTLPQFAAAAAFYRTADPRAPRLILLDEAFVGIDADMRAKCMGLIEIYDLDLMMTSEREWGCYQTLSGLAICQLSTRPGIDAIGLTRWVWNGHQRNLIHSASEAYDTSDPHDLVAVESPQRR